jgi:hypothetical protein
MLDRDVAAALAVSVRMSLVNEVFIRHEIVLLVYVDLVATLEQLFK